MKSMVKWARKSLAMVGLVSGMMVGGTSAASAETFNFAYTSPLGAFSAVFDAVLGPGGYWRPVAGSVLAGSTFNGQPITALVCHWCDAGPGFALTVTDNYFNGPAGVSEAQVTFIAGGQEFAYTWLRDFGYPGKNSQGTVWVGNPSPQTNIAPLAGGVGYAYTSACIVDSQRCFRASGPTIAMVPEINASAGFGALGVLFGFLFILREMFLRRRDSSLAA